MPLLIVLIVLGVVFIVLIVVPRRRSPVDQLIDEVQRTDDEDELAQAEDEVRQLDALATPEDAKERLPDWGPGVPKASGRKRQR